MVDQRGLPASIEAERLVLGSILMDDALMHDVRPVLAPEDFSLERNRRIWRRACERYDAGKPVDRITVFTALQEHKEAANDELSYIASLDEGLPRLPNIAAYVQTVRDKSTLRRIMYAADQVTKRCQSGEEGPQALLESLGRMVLDLAPQEPGQGLQSAAELVDEVGLGQLLAPRKEKGLAFPWTWMNRMTCGMLPAELWILAGHTSTGKTSAMLQHAVTAARRGVGVAIFSLEVGKQSLFQKACYQLSRIDSEKAKRGGLNGEERSAIHAAANELYKLPIYFDTQSSTVMAMHAAVRRRRLKGPVDHVIVDYLQLLGNSGRFDKRADAVGANAWALKMLASDFQIPVLCLSQFSRESNKPGKQRRPELSDLKETGDIENHANGVWFIHRESMEDAEQIGVEFMLPKQRDGRRNVFSNYWFFPRFQSFAEVERDDYQSRLEDR
jgi:replicative DNA helicase